MCGLTAQDVQGAQYFPRIVEGKGYALPRRLRNRTERWRVGMRERVDDARRALQGLRPGRIFSYHDSCR
jgi:hypothetical protein